MVRMPQVTAAALVRFLKSQGFVEDRQQGSHLALRHTERAVSVTVPMHTGVDVGRGLAVRVFKDAGFTVEDFFASARFGTAFALSAATPPRSRALVMRRRRCFASLCMTDIPLHDSVRGSEIVDGDAAVYYELRACRP